MGMRRGSLTRSLVQIHQRVFEIQLDKIAGAHAQRGRLMPLAIQIAVAHLAVRLEHVMHRKVQPQDAVVAAQVHRLGHHGSGLWPRAIGLLRMQASGAKGDAHGNNCNWKEAHRTTQSTVLRTTDAYLVLLADMNGR